jgi:hypothetical protein
MYPSVNLTPAWVASKKGEDLALAVCDRPAHQSRAQRHAGALSSGVGPLVDHLAHGLAQQVDRGRAEGVEGEGEGGVVGEILRGHLLHAGSDAADGKHDRSGGVQVLGDERARKVAAAESEALVAELFYIEAPGENDRGQKGSAGCDGLLCDTERGRPAPAHRLRVRTECP